MNNDTYPDATRQDTTLGETTRRDTDIQPRVYGSTLVTTTDGEPSLGDLVVGLTDDISTLVRKEMDLAKAELQESAQQSARAGGMIAAGGLVAYAGLILILIALAVLLGQWWDNFWLGSAVVGLVTIIIGGILLYSGMNQLKKVSLVPRKTVSSLNRDAEMAKEKLS